MRLILHDFVIGTTTEGSETTTEPQDLTTNAQTSTSGQETEMTTTASNQEQTTTDAKEETTTAQQTTTDATQEQTTTLPAEQTTESKEDTTTLQQTTDLPTETTTESNREETTVQQTTAEANPETTTQLNVETTTNASEETTSLSVDTTSKPSSKGNSSCPPIEEGQAHYVCPTGFRQHPRDCGMFYQCTESPETSHLSIVTFNCPNGTVYDEDAIQCRDRTPSDNCPTKSQAELLLRGTIFDSEASPLVSITFSVLLNLIQQIFCRFK